MASQDSRKPEVPAPFPERALLDGRGAFMGFLVKRLGNRSDAEDVLQEFCIRVLTRKDQLRDVDRMDGWLYTILRSTLNDYYRKGTRRTRLGAYCPARGADGSLRHMLPGRPRRLFLSARGLRERSARGRSRTGRACILIAMRPVL